MKIAKALAFVFLLSLLIPAVVAQEPYMGAVAVCGEDALTITAADDHPEDETTLALDNLLRQLVTFPAEGEAPLQSRAVPAPGAVIYVESPSGRYLRSIGVSDLESCESFAPTVPFPIGSNTKMMTATVIYQLQEEGLLSTSDLVSDYLPDLIALWPGTETITIDMLLTHTSGLPDYLNSQSPTSIGKRLETADDLISTGFTPQELLQNSAEADPALLFAPGSAGNWQYSNDGYIMLGLIIEQVTGKSYIDNVNERIIEPLGLENTVLVPGVAPDELGLVGQYDINPATLAVRDMSAWNFSQAWSAGNAVTTPEDLGTFVKALYTGQLFQNEDTLAAYTTRAAPEYAAETADFYYVHGGYYKGGFWGHGGQTLGTESDPGYNPEEDTIIVVWSNVDYAYTGAGVFHVGNVLGLTRSWHDVYHEIAYNTSPLPKLYGVELVASDMTAAGEETITFEEGANYSITLIDDST
ncbi:MAG: beta-lactamase family protein, partial [Anaerolineae bacterium]|nr:beta-lactamase family protein [Anaerolineae bacterium]